METSLQREWQNRLSPVLSALPWVNGIGLGKVGLVIYLERDEKGTRDKIDTIFEQEAPDVPFCVRVVGKIKAALS